MSLLSVLLILLSALFFPGIIARTKALVVGRKQPPVLQPVYDVLRLLRKGSIYSTTTGFVFRLAPLVYLATVLVSVLFLPLAGQHGLLGFDNDLVFFAYLLALGKFFMILAALDCGSGFEGMGANREALYSMLVEPAFFVTMGSLALFTGCTSFHELFTRVQMSTDFSYIIGISAVYVFVFIAMIENSRLPVDDPRTHLELTMVHEVMVLDYSGFDLGLIQMTSWLKFSLYTTLISNFMLPVGWHLSLQIGLFFLLQAGTATVVGLLESFRARNKMEKNPQWILMLSAIAIVTFLATLIIAGKIMLS